MNDSLDSALPEWESSPVAENVAEGGELSLPESDVEFSPRISPGFYVLWVVVSTCVYSFPPQGVVAWGDAGIGQATGAVVVAALLAGSLLVLPRLLQIHRAYPLSAGHWLCLVVLMFTVIDYVALMLQESRLFADGFATEEWSLLKLHAMGWGKGVALVIPTFVLRKGTHWKAFFLTAAAGMMILHSVPVVLSLVTLKGSTQYVAAFRAVAFYSIGMSVLLALLFTILDAVRWRHYDWIHWLGLTFVLFYPTAELARWFVK